MSQGQAGEAQEAAGDSSFISRAWKKFVGAPIATFGSLVVVTGGALGVLKLVDELSPTTIAESI